MKNHSPSAFALLILLGLALPASAAEKSIAVFIALCDNDSQSIQPVPEKIGNGDDPASNLYWGCSDGLSSFFRKSPLWNLTSSEKKGLEPVLEKLTFRHAKHECSLVAHAYRGNQIKQCLEDYFKALANREADLVCFVGHNGLMDFSIELPEMPAGKKGGSPDAIALCCISDAYFSPLLRRLGARPVLLTRQLMYPGSFVIHEAAEAWLSGKDREAIRSAAGRSMAKNQRISISAATGIFTPVRQLDSMKN